MTQSVGQNAKASVHGGIGILNFRDLGGLPCQNGRRVRPHKLLRSAALTHADNKDCATLCETYDLGTIIDLRTRIERNSHPDVSLDGIYYVAVSLMPAQTIRITFEDDNWQELLRGNWTPDTYDACAAYRMMADPHVGNTWRTVFKALLNSDNRAVLWHCTNGKDRTGVVAAVVLRTLGVSYKTIMIDYLQSNAKLKAQRDHILQVAHLRKDEPDLSAKVGPLLEARPEYLNAFFDAIDNNYGSFDIFLEDICQLSIAEDDELRHLFLF